MSYKLLHLGLILFAQCTLRGSKHFELKQIVGEWRLIENQINYPLIQFYSDSTAIFKSKADTIYRFSFVLKGDSLILKDTDNKQTINRIKRLNQTELVFYNLLEHAKEQAYNKEY